jgi:hypothetical protein
MRLMPQDLIRFADTILDEAFEIWIVAAEGGAWLIEVTDEEVCYRF